MTDAKRTMEVFERALALEEEERASFLAGECADDEGLRHEVGALLRADASAASSDFLAIPLQALSDRSGE